MAQRGFKAQTRRQALEVRTELGTGPHEVLDVFALADLYGVPIVHLSDLRESDCPRGSLDYYLNDGASSFSAAAVPIDSGGLVVVNDAHPPVRVRSSLAHELAHWLLEHPFPVSLCVDGVCRVFDAATEEQANLLAGELLIPTDAAHRLAALRWSDHQVAELHNVSVRFAKMRMDQSGARKRAERARMKRNGT